MKIEQGTQSNMIFVQAKGIETSDFGKATENFEKIEVDTPSEVENDLKPQATVYNQFLKQASNFANYQLFSGNGMDVFTSAKGGK